MTPQEKTWLNHTTLTDFYGPVALGNPRRGPLHELISTLLSHRTTHKDEEAAYYGMFEAFGDWHGIMAAPTKDLAHAIRTTRWPDTQAPRIQEVLRRIEAERGELSVDFLADMSTDEAMKWLTDLPGVGLKTASLVLLFNFQKPVMPVDTHVHRVAQRMGIIGPKVTHDKAHALFLDLLPRDPEVLYNYHVHNLWHGQRICFFTAPNCPACPLRAFCDYGLARLGKLDATL